MVPLRRYGFLSQVLWLPIHQEFVDSGHFFLRDRLGSAVKKCGPRQTLVPH